MKNNYFDHIRFIEIILRCISFWRINVDTECRDRNNKLSCFWQQIQDSIYQSISFQSSDAFKAGKILQGIRDGYYMLVNNFGTLKTNLEK